MKTITNVSKSTDVSKLAGFITVKVRAEGAIILKAVAAKAVYRTVRAISVAEKFIVDDGDSIKVTVNFTEVKTEEDAFTVNEFEITME